MRAHRLDLHIHSCLSPCADLEMMPSAIVRRAKECGLDGIALCDHNASGNVAAICEAGKREGLCVIPGMEIASSEEVHTVGLFADISSVMRVEEAVQSCLPGENDEKYFGEQLLADADGNIEGKSERMLIGASTLSLASIVALIHSEGGLAIASHIDREAFSVLGQLGVIPPELDLDALELSFRGKDSSADYAGLGMPLVTSSDAHYLSDIGKAYTSFEIESVCLKEIAMAFEGSNGRGVEI
jgi:PHP family Zn ribbon phosphoesterase